MSEHITYYIFKGCLMNKLIILLVLVMVPFFVIPAASKECSGMRIAINGFGRIGRNLLRAILSDRQAEKKLEVVAINVGPSEINNVGHIFKYDSVMGTFKGTVSCQDKTLIVNDHSIELLAITDPSKLNWQPYNINWVVDASGKYTSENSCQVHIVAGAEHTLITAPCKGNVTTIVPGVNDDQFDLKKDKVVSLASCTTNAIMPMLKVLHEAFDIEKGFMTTIHAYTNTQVLLDAERGDLRRSRAATLNIIPTSTGAAQMIDRIMPELEGRIQATAVRVPVSIVSLVELIIQTKKEMNVQELNSAFDAAAGGKMKGILGASSEELVSSDYAGCDYSVVIDTLLTQADGHMSKIFGWYDNEWGYSMRLKDFLLKIAG